MQKALILRNFSPTFRDSKYTMTNSPVYRIVLSAVALWCLLILLPPLVMVLDPSRAALARWISEFFSPVCHQLDSHSLHLFGHPLAVCARCFAIYVGFFAGGILAPHFRLRRFSSTVPLWIAGALPMLLDVALDVGGFHPSSNLTRVITGSIFGVAAAVVLFPLAVDALSGVFRHHPFTKGATHEFEAR